MADRFNFFVIGYNTNLVKPEDAPKSFARPISAANSPMRILICSIFIFAPLYFNIE